MGISFHETMRGHLKDRWGCEHPIDFEIRAEASHVQRFVGDGRARLSGVVHAPPWADHAPLDGTIEISPLKNRRIAYRLAFVGDDDRGLIFEGTKDLSWRRPLATLTTLQGRLRAGDTELARGTMQFDLSGLLAFGASWWPSSSFRGPSLQAAGEPGVSLSSRDRATLASVAQAMLEPGEHVPAADEQTLTDTLALLGKMPAHIVAGFRAGLVWLDAVALAERGRRFSKLSLTRRRALLDAVERAEIRLPHPDGLPPGRVLQLVGFALKTAHFSRRDYLDSVGFPQPRAPAPEPPPRWMGQVAPPESLDEESVLEADVLVVGTGAGGATLAAGLAERGLAVAMIEEGRYHQRHEFTGSPLERSRKLWRSSGMTFSVGNPPISIPLGKLVGGTTAINSGTCFRTPDEVLESWRAERGLPEDFTPENFAPHLDRVQQELRFAPNDRKYLGRIADVVARGADALGLEHGPLPRNAPGCDGQGACIFGCPTAAKRSTDISYVPRALRAGAQLFTGMRVTRILTRGRRAVGVEARGVDEHGASKKLTIKARAVVLACGSVATPTLLADNGFRLPALGRNLSVHPALGMWVRCDDDMEPWRAVPQGYGFHAPEARDVRFEGFYLPPHLAGGMVPLHGPELTRWMDGHRHVGQFGFMVRDQSVGSVRRAPGGAPIIRYDLTDATAAQLQLGASLLAEVLLKGGGREVLTCISGVEPIRTVQQARDLRRRSIAPIDFNLLGAHPLGTCRMGASAADAVVDSDHRVFGTDNLYVVDGSAVPSSLGVNPQVTIMAMATRAADLLADRLA